MYCKYSDIFGKVKTGIHSYRVFDIAIMDVILTIIGAFILQLLFPTINFFVILLMLFGIGIGLHRLFCVRTTVDKLLFE
jgi:uncharacterized membrane protein YcaP (DUF421 family)